MKVVRILSGVMNIAASCVLVAMLLLTVFDVCLRYFFSSPILGTTEFTECMMVSIAFLGFAWCASDRSHLSMDLIMSSLPQKTQAFADFVTSFLGIIVVAVIAWRTILEGAAIHQLNVRISPLSLNMPAYPFYYMVGFGCGVLCLIILTHMIEDLGKVFKR